MDKIDFFDSLLVPFRLWQCICLSPFNLRIAKKNVIPSNWYRNFSIVIILIQVLQIILSFIFLDHLIPAKLTKSVRTLDILTLTLIQFTTLMIFWESYSKRDVQMNFLRKISSIDFILEYKVGIHPTYKKQKKIIDQRLLRWLMLDIVIFMINFGILFVAFDISYRHWTIYYLSFVICSLRYYQITTYVDIIFHRYDQINQFINHLQPFDDNQKNVNVELVKTMENIRNIFHTYKCCSIYEKLRDVRRVCRLLNSANDNINEMFQSSFPLIIVNDFLQILINSYWVLRILLNPHVKIFYLIPPLFWTFLNFNHVVSLANVCHHATEEVYFSFLKR